MTAPDATPTGPHPRRPKVTLVPLMGPLHLRFPQYNAASVAELLDELHPEALLTSALEPGALADPGWRDTPELPLPHTVAPWARRHGLALVPVGTPSPDADAHRDFARYAAGFPALQRAWRDTEALLAPLGPLLAEPLTLPRILREVLPLLAAHQREREARFGDGPATDWLRARTAATAERVLEAAAPRTVLLAPVEQLPLLRDALAPHAELPPAPEPPATAAVQRRALLDFAMRGEAPDPGALLARLRQLDEPEARYHEANLLLAHGHPAEALELLRTASRGDFSEPYFLPGYLLARLGQLHDLAGERRAALRAYRGVRALSYAPPEALESAAAGLERPFEPPGAEAGTETGVDARADSAAGAGTGPGAEVDAETDALRGSDPAAGPPPDER